MEQLLEKNNLLNKKLEALLFEKTEIRIIERLCSCLSEGLEFQEINDSLLDHEISRLKKGGVCLRFILDYLIKNDVLSYKDGKYSLTSDYN